MYFDSNSLKKEFETMKTVWIKTTLGSGLAALAALSAAPAAAMDILARVISSTPVVQQVAVQRQVCNNQVVTTQAPKSGAGALIGAVAGGVLGNTVGGGTGRTAATMLGVLGGAIVGDNIEGSDKQLQNVQQCSMQTFYENRASHYNVDYEYQGARYSTQMANDPGGYVRLQVTPVGGTLPAAAAPVPTYPAYPAGQPYQPVQTLQPAPLPQAPVYYQPQVIQQPVYVQPVAYPMYIPQTYAPQPYYAPPAYSPVGVSLNFGYNRGFGGGYRGYGNGGYRGHWR